MHGSQARIATAFFSLFASLVNASLFLFRSTLVMDSLDVPEEKEGGKERSGSASERDLAVGSRTSVYARAALNRVDPFESNESLSQQSSVNCYSIALE